MEKSQSNIILEDQKFSVVFNAQDKSSSSENPKTIISEIFKSIDTGKTIDIEKITKSLNYYFVETQKMISPKGAKIIDFFDKECDEKDIENIEIIINNKLSEIKKKLKESNNNALSYFNKIIKLSKNNKINFHLNDNENYTIIRKSISPRTIKMPKNQNQKTKEITNNVEEISEEINPLNERKNNVRAEEIIYHFQNLMPESENEEKISRKNSFPDEDKKNSKIKYIKIFKKIHN